MKSFVERFEDKIFYSPCGCWFWTGTISGSGYGYVSMNHLSRRAHRVSYEMYKGKIAKGKLVCHSCDNRICVNPDHLFLGTQKDNIRDMYNKGRDLDRKGELSHTAKLSNEDVLSIRELAKKGKTYFEIAPMFGIVFQTVGDIVTRKSWKHI